MKIHGQHEYHEMNLYYSFVCISIKNEALMDYKICDFIHDFVEVMHCIVVRHIYIDVDEDIWYNPHSIHRTMSSWYLMIYHMTNITS